jgi:hypothetical protein
VAGNAADSNNASFNVEVRIVQEAASTADESVTLPDSELQITRHVLLGIAQGIIELLRSSGLPRPFEIQLNELLEAVVNDAAIEWLLPKIYVQLEKLVSLGGEISLLADEQNTSGTFQNVPKLAELIDRLAQVLTVVRGCGHPFLIDSAEEILGDLQDAKKEVDASELVLAVAQTASAATAFFGSREKAEEWLVCPNGAIGGATPISLLKDLDGAKIVQGLLTDE